MQLRERDLNASTAPAPAPKRSCTIVVIGDGSVGKTCLCYSYDKGGEFFDTHCSTIFHNFTTDIEIEHDDGSSETINVSLWDTAGQEKYKMLRESCYMKVDVFLVCFALDNPTTATNVERKWLSDLKSVARTRERSEINSNSKDDRVTNRGKRRYPFSVVLVGTKSDLAKDTSVEPEVLRREIGADAYVECSAKAKIGIAEVFDTALRKWYEKEWDKGQEQNIIDEIHDEKIHSRISSRRCTIL
eukprot:Tbor_TRINITY_DN2824_c0_g1::TRINITY_DN2824_c0_g1_i2::g.23198::m.23198